MTATTGPSDEGLEAARSLVTAEWAAERARASPPQVTLTEATPAQVGRYVIGRELGTGGMGVVYEAHDPELERSVAIKVLRSPRDRERLTREARALAKLSHPNVVTIYDVGTFGDHAFIAMELIDGVTLRSWMTECQRTLQDIANVMLQAGKGLAAAHAAGLTHRDFKPDNVMVGRDGRVRVLDFGIVSLSAGDPAAEPPLSSSLGTSFAKEAPRLTAAGSLLGTPAYMAPEQARSRAVSASADQFSFCVVLWELLVGSRPFPPQSLLELMRNGDHDEVVEPQDQGEVPHWLYRVLRRGLASVPTRRYPSMSELLDTLERGLARHTVECSRLGYRYETLLGVAEPTGGERAVDRLTGKLVTVHRFAVASRNRKTVQLELASAFRRLCALRLPASLGLLDFGQDSEARIYLVVAMREGLDEESGHPRQLIEAHTEISESLTFTRARALALAPLSDHLIAVLERQLDVVTRLLAGAGIDPPQGTVAAAEREFRLRSTPCVGRERERALLDAALERACAGRGAAWLLSGESGAGKTRLLAEVAHAALASGALVLRGQEEPEGGSPYRLFRGMLRGLALLGDLQDFEASALLPAVPNLAEHLGRPVLPAAELDARATHARLLEVVQRLLFKQPHPLVILLEDLHWSRSESLDLLERIAVCAPSLPLLVVATRRDDQAARFDHPLGSLERLPLGRLDEQAVAQVAGTLIESGRERKSVVDLLFRNSEGNAFYLLEVVRALAEDAGGLDQIAERSLRARVIAGGAGGLVQKRLRSMPPAALALLRPAAMIGRRVDPRLLATLLPGLVIEEIVASCLDAAIFERHEDGLRFRHDLLREGVLVGLHEPEASALHQSVADAIEREYPGVPQHYAALAYHFGCAGVAEKEAHYAALAGEYALLNGALQEAAELLERARGLLSGRSDAFEFGRICSTLSDAHFFLNDMPRAMAYAAQATRAVGFRFPTTKTGRLALLVWHLSLHIAYRAWPRLAAERTATRAQACRIASIATACAACVSITLADTTGVLLFSLMAWNLAERARYPDVWASGILGYGLAAQGFPRLARSYFRSTERGARALEGAYPVLKASYLLGIGDRSAAESLMEGELEFGRAAGFPPAQTFNWFILGFCAYYAGDLERAENCFERAVEHEGTRANFSPALAFVRCDTGRASHAGAGSFLQEALAESRPAAPRSLAFAALANSCARNGDQSAASRAAETAVSLAAGGKTFGYAGAVFFTGVFTAYLGELEQAQRDGTPLEPTLRRLRRLDRHCRAWARAFQVGLPLSLLYRGKIASLMQQPERARRAWRQSALEARRLGLGLYVTLAERELSDCAGTSDEERERARASSPT